MSTSDLSRLVERLEKVATRLEGLGVSGSAPVASSSSSHQEESVARFVSAYDDYVQTSLNPFLESARKIGGDLAEMAGYLEAASTAQRSFLVVASQSKKPDFSSPKFAELLKPTSEQIGKASSLTQSKRTSELFAHLSTISEAIPALGWVCQEPTPVPFINEMKASGEFYGNRILTSRKGDQTHTDFVKNFKAWVDGLAAYVKEHHRTGVSWNPKGGDISAASSQAPSTTATTTTTATATSSASKQPEVAKAGLFAALNAGNVTSGLKKVTDDMKTKNRTDKVSVVSDVPQQKTTTSTAPKDTFNGTPKLELENNRWNVEFQQGRRDLAITEGKLNQTVYIYKCRDSAINVTGKVNAITLDNCQKVTLVFENAVASIDVVNSKNVTIQVTGKVPTFIIDKSSGTNVYLSKDSLEASIFTSMSNQTNINLPSGDDYVEQPIPEQFMTKVENGKLVSSVSTHV